MSWRKGAKKPPDPSRKPNPDPDVDQFVLDADLNPYDVREWFDRRGHDVSVGVGITFHDRFLLFSRKGGGVLCIGRIGDTLSYTNLPNAPHSIGLRARK
jgi:hypothetical protein